MKTETIETIAQLNAMIQKKNEKLDREELEARAALILAEESRQRAIQLDNERKAKTEKIKEGKDFVYSQIKSALSELGREATTDKSLCMKCGDILPAGKYCKGMGCPLSTSQSMHIEKMAVIHDNGPEESPDEWPDTIGLMVAALQNNWGYLNGVHNDSEGANTHIERALTSAGMPFQSEDAT